MSEQPEPTSRIAKYLAEQRKTMKRYTPQEVNEALQKGDGTILIDTRPAYYRETEGAIPGAIVLER